MKKIIYMVMMLSLFGIGTNSVKAIDKSKITGIMENAILNNEWVATTSIEDEMNVDITIFLGNINDESNSELKEILSTTKNESVWVNSCEDSNDCNYSNEHQVKFNLVTDKETGNVTLEAYDAVRSEYDAITKSNSLYLMSSAKDTGNGMNPFDNKSYSNEGAYEFGTNVIDKIDNYLGSFNNPYIVQSTLSIPKDYEHDNLFYKVVPPNNKFGRYSVTADKNGLLFNQLMVGEYGVTSANCIGQETKYLGYYADIVYSFATNIDFTLLGDTIHFEFIDSIPADMCDKKVVDDFRDDQEENKHTLNPTEGKTIAIVQRIYRIIKIAIPVLIVILSIVDFLKVVLLSDEKDYKTAWNKFVKRIGIGIIFFLVPTLVSLIISISGLETEQSFLNIFM